MAENETGYPYGTVIEHPFIAGLIYMVISEGPRRKYNEMQTVVLHEAGVNTGQIVVCNGYRKHNDQYDWKVIDE